MGIPFFSVNNFHQDFADFHEDFFSARAAIIK
jgi:hypothetical protein